MTRINKILKRIISTEKTIASKDSQNKYVFEVHGGASQGSIANDISKKYKVEVESVNIMVMPGKKKRLNRSNVFMRTPKWKKAIVQLKEGQKIDEGVKESKVKEEKTEENK